MGQIFLNLNIPNIFPSSRIVFLLFIYGLTYVLVYLRSYIKTRLNPKFLCISIWFLVFQVFDVFFWRLQQLRQQLLEFEIRITLKISFKLRKNTRIKGRLIDRQERG